MANWHTCPLQIRYADTDQMGVVHHSVYAAYCEIGRTELCRAYGVPYHEMERDGIYMMVAELSGRFLQAIRYGDAISIRTAIGKLRKRLIVFQYEIFNQSSGQVVYTGFSKHLFSRDRNKACSIPEKYYALLLEIVNTNSPQTS
ncbi:MAG: hypothetical protein CR997_02380 [Acidobacteria bacterium]|nr:MAG: hypothetical protein CR997_02380 [Acidobacteriota bacterium]